MTKSRPKRKTAAKAKPSAARTRTTVELPGELRQLADIRSHFAQLDPGLAAALHAQHDDDACKARGIGTRAADTFSGAMTWARTIFAHRQDPGFSQPLLRYFLDCLTELGHLLSGRASGGTPSDTGNLADVEHVADTLLADVTRNATDAVGTRWLPDLQTALMPQSGLDPRVSRLRQLASRLDSWLQAPMTVPATTPPLPAYGITPSTVSQLSAAADALDDAIARRPPPRQVDRDSPAINIAEGRLYFVMRTIWDDLAAARQKNKTSLLLTVTPTLLRGLNINRTPSRKAAKQPPTPMTATGQPT
jgi:hypothetical protein